MVGAIGRDERGAPGITSNKKLLETRAFLLGAIGR